MARSMKLGALASVVLTAAFDMMFVIMQRYNRPRILKIVERINERSNLQ